METVLDKKIAQSIDKHLAKYQELVKKRTALEDRLSKVDAERDSVKDTIYAKVRREYQKELDRLAKEIAPVEEEVGKIRKMIAAEIARLDEQTRDCEDKMAEIAFRQRVGEFTENDLADKRRPLEQEIDDLTGRKSELERSMRELDAQSGTVSTPAAPDGDTPPALDAPVDAPPPPPQAPGSPEPPSAKREARPKPRDPAPRTPEAEGQDLVDPSDWTREFAEDDASDDTARRAGERRPTVPAENDDPLSELADPSSRPGAKHEESSKKSNGGGAADRPKSFPVLVITRGPGAGKKLPLVPMTMTVGREHDNNIELKDEDVSRYHARIAYERGQYVLQDLESSSGTWVNDKRITEAKLTHGDKIRLGSTEMLIDFD